MREPHHFCLRTGAILFASLALTAVGDKHVQADDPATVGFESLFDGETLKGWSVSTPKAAKAWKAVDGMIVGNGDDGGRSYLVYDRQKQLSNFELKFSYRLPGKGNTGVNIRAKPDPTGKRDFQAYHVDLGHVGIGKQILGAWDFHTPGRREHRCHRGERLVIAADDTPTLTKIEGAVTPADIRKHDWNHVHVIAKGNHFQFLINDKPAAEFTEQLPNAKRLACGMIQLQLHDPGMIVHFKDLWLKKLP